MKYSHRIIVAWFCGIMMMIGIVVGYSKMMIRIGILESEVSKYKVPSGISEEMKALYTDWTAGKLIERKSLHMFRDPICVDIVRDHVGVAYGFARMREPTGPLVITYFEGCSIFNMSELEPKLILVLIKKREYLQLPLCENDQPLPNK